LARLTFAEILKAKKDVEKKECNAWIREKSYDQPRQDIKK